MTSHSISRMAVQDGEGNTVYLWLPTEGLPALPSGNPFRAIVVSELHSEAARQSAIFLWLAASGCRFMMAWGQKASSWDDCMDRAALKRRDYVVDAESEDFIMTSWHDGEPLSEVFGLAESHANHSTLKLQDLLVLDLASRANQDEVMEQAAS